MADLIAYQDGNWTGATTWASVVTSTGATVKSWTAASSSSTSYQYCPAFTITNGAVVDGVLLYLSRNTSSGTFTVALSDDNGVTAAREVTINASDIPSVGATHIFFKFASTITGNGGSTYRVGVRSSVAGTINVFRSSTANDWSRLLRTTSAVNIAATDTPFILGSYTAAATVTPVTVTMDFTSLATSYGEVHIGQSGTLTYGTNASTNYALKLAGTLLVLPGATFNIGTSGTRIPSTSNADLEFACSTNVQFGLEVNNGGTCNIYGATKQNTKVLLTQDANSGQAVVRVTSTTGWAVGDDLGIAATTRTPSQSERRTISTIDSGTQVTVNSNLSNTHQGTSPYQGEVINLTRNVKIRGTSASLQTYVNCAATSTFYADNAEFQWLGSNVGGKEGIVVNTSSAGVFSLTNCASKDNSVGGGIAILTANAGSGSPIIDNNVFYHLSGIGIFNIRATSGVPVVTNNWAMGSNANPVFTLSDVGGTITGNVAVGGATGFTFNEAGATIGTFANNTAHSGGSGIFNEQFQNTVRFNYGTISNFTSWRGSDNYWYASGTVFDGCSFYHNSGSGLHCGMSRDLIFRNCTFNGGTGQSLGASPRGLLFGPGTFRLENCSFGTTNLHGTSAFGFGYVGGHDITFVNCNVSDTLIFSQTVLLSNTAMGTSAVKYEKLNGVAGNHRAYKQYGYAGSDQSVFRTASPSEVLVPNGGSGNKLPSGSRKFAVANGQTATVSVYVRKSATYNGNQPRLILKRNIVAGITSDTVLATMSGGTGAWELLTGTTSAVSDDCVLEVFVDCDGTAGSVNVDDWNIA